MTGTLASQWDVSGAGDDTIQGFPTAISVNVGETVHFKIDTTAATYNMDIYRMGYYGGRGARKVASIAGIGGQSQPDCLSNASTGTSPASGASFTAGNAAPIAGTAADTGGGQVTRVEVSTDGGATWANAAGTTSWTFAWTPAAAGTSNIRSRATDLV